MIHATCDVLVIGGGPAGIAAASRAAELGARTLLVDEGLAPGGQIWRASHGGRQSASARRWVDRLARSGAAIRSSTSVVDIEPVDDRFHVVADAQGDVISIDAGAVVLATGARERFLPFPGWTLPNVFGVGGGTGADEVRHVRPRKTRRRCRRGTAACSPWRLRLRRMARASALVAEQAPFATGRAIRRVALAVAQSRGAGALVESAPRRSVLAI